MKIGNLEVYGIIYKITNKVNGKVYIGQTINKDGFRGRYDMSKKMNLVEGVYRYHLSLKLRGRRGFNAHLFYSIEKYGLENFEINDCFDIAFSKEELDIKEKCYILIFKCRDFNCGYNIQEGGVGGRNNEESVEKSKKTQIKNGYTRYVNQLEIPTLKIIKTYPSIASATKELGLSRSAIKNVLNPNYNSVSAGGYAWEYLDSHNPKYRNKNSYEIFKIEDEKIVNEVIKLYENRHTYKEIVVKLNITEGRIISILSNNNIKRRESRKKYEANLKRKEILKHYIEGKSLKEIRDITGYTKSIVEKAIEKYKKGIIDADGVYK